MRCTKKIIYTENLRNNINEIKKNMKAGVKLCCAVKADGYGNDGINTAKIAEEMGASYLAIATVSEGIELRQNNVKCDLLLLSPCCPEEFQELIENDITPLVFDEETIKLLNDQAKKTGKDCQSVFLAVDTGMGRIGCYPEEAGQIAEKITASSNLKLSGIYE